MSDLKHLDGAVEYLDGAKAEMIDRAATYDSPGGEKSMGKAVAALNIIAGEDIARTGMRECHGWLLMSILKRVRQFSRKKPHRDSAVDAVAYAALEAEARMNETEAPKAPEKAYRIVSSVEGDTMLTVAVPLEQPVGESAECEPSPEPEKVADVARSVGLHIPGMEVEPKHLYSDAKEPEKPSCVTCRFTTRAGGCFGCRPDFKNYKWDGFSEWKTA